MPKLRKPSAEMRWRRRKIYLQRYRERKRNKLMSGLRKTEEESLEKNFRQRYCNKFKDRKLLNMPKTEFIIKEEFKFNPNAVKRGRGRPRKDSLASNISNPHNSSFLEEDLQCSTDDDEDGFQEVSEDENNPASYLDQGERMHSMSIIGGSEGVSDLIDAAHIKTEMKIEPTQLAGEDSMDLDPNYDPSDFLTLHSRMVNNENNQHHENQNENIQNTNENKSNIQQMPLMMGSNDNMGIDDDLAISESDEEDDGNVRVKSEVFTDQLDEELDQEQSIMDMQMQQQQQEQIPIQPYIYIDQQQHHPKQNQASHHEDNNDDDWLRF